MILVDGPNFTWRAHHVGKELRSKGRLTGVLHVGLGMLASMTDLFEEQRIIFLWDRSPSFRKAIYPEYKANRDYGDDNEERTAVYAQVDIFRQVLGYIGVWQLEREEHEADDLAGIVSSTHHSQRPITLISSDKDWFQLLRGEHIVLVRGWKGKTLDRWTAERVFKEHGVPAGRWHEYTALKGDEGDNIPNIRRGIGPVAAKKILAGKMIMTPAEEAVYQRNLQLTTIRRKADGWKLGLEVETGERSEQSWLKLENTLDEYELYSVFNERRKLWIIGKWKENAYA